MLNRTEGKVVDGDCKVRKAESWDKTRTIMADEKIVDESEGITHD